MRSAHRPRPSGAGLLVALALVTLVLVAGVAALRGASQASNAGVSQDVPGHVLLVPGYGGSTGALLPLAERLESAGRRVTVVALPGDGTGDLAAAAQVLGDAADRAIREGSPSVDVVGYSAGGVVARLWAAEQGAAQARRVVTLGSPHHGTRVAALGAVFASESCPAACRQLVPGSPLLEQLNEDDETPAGPQWLSVWTEQDTVVTPPDSARLAGAEQVVVQQLCPGRQVGHGELPVDPVVQAVVLQALSAEPIRPPEPASCPAA